MEIKYKQCNDCIYSDPVFGSECEYCDNGSRQLTHNEFNEDMEIWHEDVPTPEEEKRKYFPIRWLIRLLLKYLNDDCATWFCGITNHPCGCKTKEDSFPLFLHIFFPFVYVHQWRDGGYTGDDFAGDLYFRLLPFVWLKFGYRCY